MTDAERRRIMAELPARDAAAIAAGRRRGDAMGAWIALTAR